MAAWTEAVIDDLFLGDQIRVTDTDGLVFAGEYGGFRRHDCSVCVSFPVEGFHGEAIGAALVYTHFVETRDIRRIEKLRDEECGK